MPPHSSPGFRRLPRVADQMTTAHHDLLDRSFAAERSGDAAGALALHSSIPAFKKRSRHHVMLSQLAALSDDLPDWACARWFAYQTTRCEDSASESGRLQRQALKYAVETFHDDQLADCHADGGDPLKVLAWVAAESWLFHQVLVHELGGLQCFVDELLTGRAAERSDLARSWVGARLGGYRVGAGAEDGQIRITDLADGTDVEVLDLGARECAGTDGTVLGRLVPSGVGDLLIFDTPPIAVPHDVARDVAQAAQPWLTVKNALDEGRLIERDFMRSDVELVTDIPSIELLRLGTPAAELERVTAQLRAGRDEIPRAAFRILRRASEGRVDHADAPHVAAAVLQPTAWAEARHKLVREGAYDVWSGWASRVHEPARRQFLALADACRAAA